MIRVATVDQLLFRAESETLDFKRDQYAFAGADDVQKSELLKDILAMANAWRSEPAFILVGVDDTATTPVVVGLLPAAHFDDADLQQFVNSKVQRPVKFSYYAAELQGRSVGVFEIAVQPRPIYLRQAFGKLKANVVYLRRGSSTVEALPDEVAQMGAANALLKGSDLQVRFAQPKGRQLSTTEFKFASHVLHIKEEPKIPDYTEAAPTGFHVPGLEVTNRDFYREIAALAQRVNLLQPTAITVTNAGSVAAKEIRVEFTFSDPERQWEFCAESDYDTEIPRRRVDRYGTIMSKHALRAVAHRGPGYEIEYLDGTWHLNFDFGYLQPGRTLWPALAFYVGARQSATMQLVGSILADGLPAASTCTLQLVAEVTASSTTLRKLVQQLDKSVSDPTDE